MVFLTVGNSDPFDRLVQAFDEWVSLRPSGNRKEIVAQIGHGHYLPKNCPYVRFLTPVEYRATFERAEFVVAHAGLGTIITAIEFNKPLIVMPKLASLGEQRNEHQLATVRAFRKFPFLRVIDTEVELPRVLNSAMSEIETKGQTQQNSPFINDFQPSPTLINFVNQFVHQS